MQMGATAGSEDFEEDYGAVDIMSSLERDIGNLFNSIHQGPLKQMDGIALNGPGL
jgi:hypothetical protein